MTAIAIVVLVIGLILLAIEAHVPTAGLIGGAGVLALIGGAALVALAAGGGALLAVAVAGTTAAAGGTAAIAVSRRVTIARRALPRGGASGLLGRIGVVRAWNGDNGRVFVDGALWRARNGAAGAHEPIKEGDRVVVDHVHGLTLRVRRAEEWEVPV